MDTNIFDEIYTKDVWGSSGYGSKGAYLSSYVEAVAVFLESVKPKTIIDLGCGDFNVGQHLVNYCERYTACDVSEVIINRNIKRFNIPNVRFRHLDICRDTLPVADVAIIRQVLQHLSNESILRFINQVNNKTPFKFLVFTDHLPIGNFIPNIDKPTNPHIRLDCKNESGVEIDKEPFNLKFKSKKTLSEIKARGGCIRSVSYELF